MMHKRSLQRRFLSVSIIIIVLMALSLVLMVLFVRKDLEEDMIAHNAAMTQAVSLQFQSIIELPMQLIARVDHLISKEYTVESEEVTSYLEVILDAHDYLQEIQLIDYEGYLVNTAPYSEDLIGTNVIQKPFFVKDDEQKISW